jgi:hypothetical protein
MPANFTSGIISANLSVSGKEEAYPFIPNTRCPYHIDDCTSSSSSQEEVDFLESKNPKRELKSNQREDSSVDLEHTGTFFKEKMAKMDSVNFEMDQKLI